MANKSDIELYNRWKNDPSKDNFQKIYNQFKPILRKAIQKASYTSTVPESAFKLQAAQQFHDSLNKYDPSAGAQLHSYIFGTVEDKVKRVNYNYGNIARLPERSGGNLGAYHIGPYLNTKEILREKLGREPSAPELADEMNVGVDKIEQFEAEQTKNLSLNEELEDLATFQDVSADEAELAMRYYDMSPEQQVVFDYATGKHGKPKMVKPSGKVDWHGIAQASGMSIQKVQRARDKIVKNWGT